MHVHPVFCLQGQSRQAGQQCPLRIIQCKLRFEIPQRGSVIRGRKEVLQLARLPGMPRDTAGPCVYKRFDAIPGFAVPFTKVTVPFYPRHVTIYLWFGVY